MSRSRRHAAGLGLLGLGLSACAVGPNFHPQAPSAAASYGKTNETAISASNGVGGAEQRLIVDAPVPARWWTAFGSPTLDGLVDQALKTNSDLAAAEAALRAAHETTLAQSGAFLPTVDAAAGSSRNKSSTYLSPVLGVSQYYYSLQTAQVNVGYAPDVFGGVRRQIEAARASEDQQRYQTEAVRQTLIANLVAAVFTEASLRAQIAAQEQIVVDSQRILAVTRGQAAQGQIAAQAVAVQEGALAQA
ncbi:MAG: TolC family protein, partial [Alphaproteobacteria bacterium]|nr:TolC family protein [Alphaproteobacteria bacterium]